MPRTREHVASLNELACLEEYALHLLDHPALPDAVETLAKVTGAIKLRVSWLAQAAADAVRPNDETSAKELGHLRLQPTSDDRILQSIGLRGPGNPPLVVVQ